MLSAKTMQSHFEYKSETALFLWGRNKKVQSFETLNALLQ